VGCRVVNSLETVQLLPGVRYLMKTPAATKIEELMADLLEKNAKWLEQLDDIVLKQKDTEDHIGAIQGNFDSM